MFGHVHEGYGAWTNGETTFVNAATCDKRYEPVNPPVMIKMARKKYLEAPYRVPVPSFLLICHMVMAIMSLCFGANLYFNFKS